MGAPRAANAGEAEADSRSARATPTMAEMLCIAAFFSTAFCIFLAASLSLSGPPRPAPARLSLDRDGARPHASASPHPDPAPAAPPHAARRPL